MVIRNPGSFLSFCSSRLYIWLLPQVCLTVRNSCSSSNHHFHVLDKKQEGLGVGAKTAQASFLIPFKEQSHPIISVYISLATPGCRGAWEMQSFSWVSCLPE